MDKQKSGPQRFPETTLFFRTPAQMKILAKVVLDEKVSNISDLARFAGIKRQNARAEVLRLEHFGIISTEKQGKNTLVYNQLKGAMLESIVTLLMPAVGPVALAPKAFADLEGLEQLFIIGSWASRYEGQVGHLPRDIDIVLVGNPNPSRSKEAAESLRSLMDLGLEVQIFIVETQKWENKDDSFWSALKAKPKIDLTQELNLLK